MTNRLPKSFQAKDLSIAFCLFFLPAACLQAQPDFFNFSYNGPDSLTVDIGCSSMLQGNVPNPVVTPKFGGAIITMSMFDPVASGFPYDFMFTSGTVAHIFWFVKDDLGHSHTFEYYINFVDDAPPTFDLTGVFDTLEFSSIVQVPTQTALPVTDNCTAVVSDTFYQTVTPDTCQSGTFTRTWEATDANGNTATYTQTIIIYQDTLPPQITGYPQSGSAACEQLATAYPAWRALQIANFAATDASGVKSLITNAPTTFPPGCKEPLTVKFWAIDNCMIQQIVTVVFTTSDTEDPVVIKPPKDTVAYCSQSDNELAKLREWISTKAYSQVFDSCSYPLTYSMKIGTNTVDSAQVVAAFLASFANGCSAQKVHGLVSVNFFVEDDCGNSALMGNAEFAAIDTLRPTITGTNTTEQCGGANDQTALRTWINAHGNATVTEDCSNFTWTDFTFSTSNGLSGAGTFNAGPYPAVLANNCTWFTDVTFRATDDCGNSNTITLRWSIVDTQAPTFAGLAPSITVHCPNSLPTVPAATVSDNCDATPAITFARIYKDSICDGSYTVRTTWTATDDCGNADSVMQDIFVRDTTRPVFTLIPANKTFRCDTFVLPPVPVMGMNILATDICSPIVSITTATSSFQNPDPAVCGHYSYNIVRTFTATDECQNTRTATQTISVIDNLGPVPGGILDTTVLCNALLPFPAPPPIATDACSGPTAAPTASGQTNTLGNCTDRYTIMVHWSAKDVCNNLTTFNQVLHVIDTVPPALVNIPPNVTVECDAIPLAPPASTFNPSDNCDLSVAVNLVQTEIRNPDPDTCEHWTNYIVKREWTATDNCGNSRTYTQLIQIEDTTPPAIVPPAAMMFPTDLGDCGAEVTIPAPLSVTDVCSNQLTTVILKDTMALVFLPNPPNSPYADTVVFQLSAPNLPPFQPIVGNATLTIFIDQADADAFQQEFFLILGENATLLDTTNSVVTQCSSSTTTMTIPSNLLNNWMADGSLTITLAPNKQTINNPCPNLLNRVRANLSYSYSTTDVPIALTYSLDGGASQNFPPAGPATLTTGTHTVIYTATDCAGNAATSLVQINVNDTQPPSMTAPANITTYTGQNNCESPITMQFPAITENCTMSASLTLASAVLPLQFTNDPDVGLVASDILLTLTGIVPNAVGMGVLKIRHKGDNAQVGEFFRVFDEFNTYLDTTKRGDMLGECSTFFETSIDVSAQSINDWATMGGALGNTSFSLKSNKDPLNDVVSNCAALLPNGTDGISQVQVVLEYSYAVVDYFVKNTSNQVVSTGTLTGSTTKDTLSPGNYSVMYLTTDNAGLTGMASFAVTVRDTVKPKALCQPTFIIQVDPSGAGATVLSPASINNNSTDNCTPAPNLLLSVSPSQFNCNQAGSTVNVTLTVTDTSGNAATCNSMVGVVSMTANPAYTPVCENGALQLFANPPSGAPYFYNWSGPGGYTISGNTIIQQNPVVTNNAMAVHNGPYCVTITGSGFCSSTACVVVNLAILATTPSLGGNGFSFCPGQNIVIGTTNYSGQNVSYQWLVDSVPALPGGPIVMGTTTTLTNFTIPNPPPGTYTYYVKVFANGCNTALSNPLMVTMHPTPPAAVDPPQVLICEGAKLMLNSTTPPLVGLTYMWMHPSGWTSSAQSPTVTNSAVKSQHEGIYTLRTKRFGCLSNPANVVVTIDPKPPKPSISGNANLCEGQTLTLVCNNLNAAQYVWTLPDDTTIITTTNSLTLPNVTTSDAGNYTVFVAASGCFSDESNAFVVDIQAYPIVTADSNAPICQDSLLELTATFSSTVPLAWCWTGPNGFEKYEQNPTLPNGASGTYQVIGKTSFGCADTATVDVTNVVAPIIDSIGNNAPACCDFTTDAALSAIITSAHGQPTYLWTGPSAFGVSTLANPVIGDVCVEYNGQYTLVVKDTFGCPSLPATTEINIQVPPATPTLTPLTTTKCAGADVMLSFQNSTLDATYRWNRPGTLSDTITMVAELNIPNAQPWHNGTYTVTAISANGTCQSDPSTAVTVTINAIPPAPAISSNSPVCEGATLTFSASSIPGATYMWTGPGFNDLTQNPERHPVTLTMAGVYTLKVTKDDCTSPDTSLTVMVVETPKQPLIATPPARICMDVLPVGVFLNVTSPVNGMVYTWQEEGTSTQLAPPSTASQLNLDSVLTLLGPGEHTFWVRASTFAPPGCESDFSNIVTVRFDTIPAGVNAGAGMDRPACVTNAIPLTATPNPLPDAVTGFWTQVGLPLVTIDNANSPNASFNGGAANTLYTFVWSLSNGACMNFSSDMVQITAQDPEPAIGGDDIYSCELTGIQLHATQGTTVQGKWTQLQSQAGLGVVIDNPDDPNTTISGLPGRGQTYVFYWEIGNPGCGTNSDPVVVYVYSPKPSAGPIQFVCDQENCADLQASVLADFEIGQWSSNDLSLDFSNPNFPNSNVCGLKPGKNEIYWTINNGVCGDQSRDTVEINYEIYPEAVADVVPVDFGGTAQFNVLLNDVLPGAYTYTLATPPALGRLIDTLGIGVYIYRPQSGFTGSETMTYTIKNNNCPGSLSIGTVTFQVGDAPDCFIPTIITPNGDGFNDVFTIPSVCTVGEGDSELDVTIFNQWGDAVFHAKPYANDWGGTYNAEELPAGTYFFVVKLHDEDKPRTGFLLIQR